MKYLATINVPGYSPMDDDPPVFDTAAEAWAYLADERRRGEDDVDPVCATCAEPIHQDNNGANVLIWCHDHGSTVCHDVPAGSVADGPTAAPNEDYSDTVNKLDARATAATDGAGSVGGVMGDTPGYDGDHDLGLVYSVSDVQ